MPRRFTSVLVLGLGFSLAQSATLHGQGSGSPDGVIQQMWVEGMERSQVEPLAQVLLDSIGPRSAGSSGLEAATAWLLQHYADLGIPARKEQFGTWTGWDPGITHVDLLTPHVRTLEAYPMGWTYGTDGPVEGDVVVIPEFVTPEDIEAWVPTVRGKFVLGFPPEVMCRAPHELAANATEATVARIDSLRSAMWTSYLGRLRPLGGPFAAAARFEAAGAAGVIYSMWSMGHFSQRAPGWGVNQILNAPSDSLVAVDVSCEHYGMLFRLASNDQGPRIRVHVETSDRGLVPQFNVIAQLTGTELPHEYVVLSAHLDAGHAAQGATDNGTGTLMLLEAMRILRATYPEPRRTIIAGHWGSEEVGLIGSAAFREDHPEVVAGLQALFNQDNGTWRIEKIEGQGFARAGDHVTRWMAQVPDAIARHVTLDFPGPQENSGSDHSSFVCAGAPAFRLQSPYDEYRQYTWHTNRDTYDKIVFDDLKNNATLAAMLVYQASEDPERVPREKAALPADPRTGQPRPWPTCQPPLRSP